MWWNKSYINRRDWMLENQGVLKLSPDQLVVLLMIDLLNSKQEPIRLDTLASACAMEEGRVDTLLHELVGQKLLAIKVSKEEVQFNIDGLFQNGSMYEFVDETIFKIFETEFGRLLSQQELMTLNEWLSVYTQEEILEALRSAMIYQKASMKYIGVILVNNRKEGAVG